MPTLRDRITEVIRSTLADTEARFEIEELATGHIAGFVISDKFGRQDDAARQERLWQALRSAVDNGVLTRDELIRVSFLITLTWEENAAYSEVDD
jgi:hypothetical protein